MAEDAIAEEHVGTGAQVSNIVSNKVVSPFRCLDQNDVPRK